MTASQDGKTRYKVTFFNYTGILIAVVFVNANGPDAARSAARKLYIGTYFKSFAVPE